jgi:hypothetical protein
MLQPVIKFLTSSFQSRRKWLRDILSFEGVTQNAIISRQSDLLLFVMQIFSNRVVNIWNHLPDSIVTAESVSCFERRLDSFDFSTLISL